MNEVHLSLRLRFYFIKTRYKYRDGWLSGRALRSHRRGHRFESYTVHMFTFLQYFIWHYYDAPKKILTVWRDFLKFGFNYFSLPLLAKTLFSHWRRYRWSYGRGFDFGRYVYVFFSNSFSRAMGAAMRIFLIVFGLFFEIILFFAGVVVFFGWLFLPAFLLFGLVFGLWLILI